MKPTLFLTLLFALSIFNTCDDDKDELNWTSLPPETQEGKGTIGCLIDGKLWATNEWDNGFMRQAPVRAYFYKESYYKEGKTYCTIGAEKKDGTFIVIDINTANIKTEKKISAEAGVGMGYLNFYVSKEPYIYLTKFDTINHIISGQFSFEAINNEDPTDTIKVTDGRFDMYLAVSDYQ